MSKKVVEGLKTLNSMLERQLQERDLDLAYLVDLLMRVTGSAPTDPIELVLERAVASGAKLTISH